MDDAYNVEQTAFKSIIMLNQRYFTPEARTETPQVSEREARPKTRLFFKASKAPKYIFSPKASKPPRKCYKKTSPRSRYFSNTPKISIQPLEILKKIRKDRNLGLKCKFCRRVSCKCREIQDTKLDFIKTRYNMSLQKKNSLVKELIEGFSGSRRNRSVFRASSVYPN